MINILSLKRIYLKWIARKDYPMKMHLIMPMPIQEMIKTCYQIERIPNLCKSILIILQQNFEIKHNNLLIITIIVKTSIIVLV